MTATHPNVKHEEKKIRSDFPDPGGHRPQELGVNYGNICSPGHPELSKSYMDMASKLFTFTFKFTCG